MDRGTRCDCRLMRTHRQCGGGHPGNTWPLKMRGIRTFSSEPTLTDFASSQLSEEWTSRGMALDDGRQCEQGCGRTSVTRAGSGGGCSGWLESRVRQALSIVFFSGNVFDTRVRPDGRHSILFSFLEDSVWCYYFFLQRSVESTHEAILSFRRGKIFTTNSTF